MAETKKPKPQQQPSFTREDLVIINNALNEICNAISIDDDEFQTRIGYPRESAERVLAKVAKSIEK